MPYQDTWAICTKCGERFVFRIEDQRRQARRGEEITPPALCPSCQTSRPRTEKGASSHPEPRQEAAASIVLGPGPHEGSVKWYDTEKGYGFIRHSSGEEIFFHRTGIAPGEVPDFPDDTRVTYCVEQTEKGPQAVEVERMDT
ncbi:MAG TPA: cold shock domain-containing protein [Chloroflexi bacterium]|nr:cold shock domain-containing protein [Chloroflexota bacterium]